MQDVLGLLYFFSVKKYGFRRSGWINSEIYQRTGQT
jgi:hypothetical protein